MKKIVFVLISLFSAFDSMWSNVPDSVYLVVYNANPSQGLMFAYSADCSNWSSICDEASFVGSDYGPWGAGKKMYRPVLTRQSGGLWQLEFQLGRFNQYARTTSPDLIHWKPQDYPFMESREAVDQRFDEIDKALFKTVMVNGVEHRGCVYRIPYAQVEMMENVKLAAAMRAQCDAERLTDDHTRFSELKDKTLQAQIKIHADAPKNISDKLIGIFFEDINYSADGGLYAELVQNRDFEYNETDRAREPKWGHDYAWTVSGDGGTLRIEDADPIHPNQKYYGVLDVQKVGTSLENSGFDGIVLRKGERYDLSLFARQLTGKAGKLRVVLREDECIVGHTTLSAPTDKWKQSKAVITVTADASHACLCIEPTTTGSVALDFVSLFPQNTFKHRKNGVRADLAQVLADLHPRFMRFPGGCVAHGNGLDNIYHWKESIGPLWERKGQGNIWHYHQSRGLGYYEFFQLCEDLGCEPLPVVAAGVCCQNSGVGGNGQQGGIPLGAAFDQYVQDVLDLIEWANGDPKTSVWARKRAEAGHPKPFNLKYIGIGNEDLIGDVFTERYLALIKAVKSKYPDITVCGTTGPFFEGSDYEEGWRLAKQHHIDMVDEHYYVSPGWYIHHQDFYDQYDRKASKVYLGEWAAHIPGRRSTIETALACGMHFCNLERNGDIVSMSSYAPLLAKHGHTQWNPDLIYFDNEHIYPTVDYEVQRMCGQSQGDTYLPTSIFLSTDDWKPVSADVQRRIAASTVRDSQTGKTYLKIANLLPQPLNISGLNLPATPHITTLSGTPEDREAHATAPTQLQMTNGVFQIPAYSFNVIEF